MTVRVAMRVGRVVAAETVVGAQVEARQPLGLDGAALDAARASRERSAASSGRCASASVTAASASDRRRARSRRWSRACRSARSAWPGRAPSARARSIEARSAWFCATSSAPRAAASCVRARITSMRAAVPALHLVLGQRGELPREVEVGLARRHHGRRARGPHVGGGGRLRRSLGGAAPLRAAHAHAQPGGAQPHPRGRVEQGLRGAQARVHLVHGTDAGPRSGEAGDLREREARRLEGVGALQR